MLLHILSVLGQVLLGLALFWAVVALGATGRMRSSAKAGRALSTTMTQLDEIFSATRKTANVYRIQAEDGREAQEDDSGDGAEPGAEAGPEPGVEPDPEPGPT